VSALRKIFRHRFARSSAISPARKDDFGLILVKYGLDRILYRLTCSPHHDAFVLKGALLFELWTHDTYRPTRDVDFLGRGDNAPERLVRLFRELCEIELEPDGLIFDVDSVRAERITEDADYEDPRLSRSSQEGRRGLSAAGPSSALGHPSRRLFFFSAATSEAGALSPLAITLPLPPQQEGVSMFNRRTFFKTTAAALPMASALDILEPVSPSPLKQLPAQPGAGTRRISSRFQSAWRQSTWPARPGNRRFAGSARAT
jgi:hypothetical protein